MPEPNPYISGVPPEVSGSYRIRNREGDIVYWGDAINLRDVWYEKSSDEFLTESSSFEFSVSSENTNRI